MQSRTATINRLRGILSEFGVVLPLKASTVRLQTAARLDEVPVMVQALALEMLAEVAHLDERIKVYEARIRSQLGGANSPVRRLKQLCGIGEMSASATVAMIGNGRRDGPAPRRRTDPSWQDEPSLMTKGLDLREP